MDTVISTNAEICEANAISQKTQTMLEKIEKFETKIKAIENVMRVDTIIRFFIAKVPC